jgi:WD40 repeat protein
MMGTMQELKISCGLGLALCVFAIDLVALRALADDIKPASYYHDILPVFKRSCTGCHHPGKLKGGLDLTSYAGVAKGGKHGPAFQAGDPAKSRLLAQVSGTEPSMPKEGDPLSTGEVALIARWVGEGAKDDSPDLSNAFKLAKAPEYSAAPVISALAFSPDGKMLAVSGYHEVLLHQGDGSGLLARLVGESPRIESLAFSSDGKWLAVSGGAPARFGEIQIWDAQTHQESKSFKISDDSLYGAAFSPDNQRLAFGCADKTLRVISAADGKEWLTFDAHSDWVFGAIFTHDGKRVLSCSRDKAMKLLDAGTGQFIDDVNKLLDGILCFARHPKLDEVIYGGDLGMARLYRISDNQNRGGGDTARDANLVREFERQPGPIHAVAFSPDGLRVALGGMGGEVRIYAVGDGQLAARLKGNQGAVFSVMFNPANEQIATGGYDGKVRLFDSNSGKLITSFIPVPISSPEKLAGAASTASSPR